MNNTMNLKMASLISLAALGLLVAEDLFFISESNLNLIFIHAFIQAGIIFISWLFFDKKQGFLIQNPIFLIANLFTFSIFFLFLYFLVGNLSKPLFFWSINTSVVICISFIGTFKLNSNTIYKIIFPAIVCGIISILLISIQLIGYIPDLSESGTQIATHLLFSLIFLPPLVIILNLVISYLFLKTNHARLRHQ